MNRPHLYRKQNDHQRSNSSLALEKYGYLIQWRADGLDSLMDVGCGSGDVLFDIILPQMTPGAKPKVFGIDISRSMIEYCEKQFEAEKNVKFIQMDILKVSDFPTDHEQVDHLTSF